MEGRVMRVLVTGGAGYIGSHAVQRLARDGHDVVVLDSLVRGHAAAVERVAAQCGGLVDGVAGGRVRLVVGDVGDRRVVGDVLRAGVEGAGFDAVLHFAALTYVGESVENPVRYYLNNTAAAAALLEAVAGAGVPRFIFSSTAATYGEPDASDIPIRETCPQRPMNPYGRSKLATEHMLEDLVEASRRTGRSFSAAALRYFNVAGADGSGVLGEDHDPETHLIPVVLQAALGRRDGVTVFGTDYATADGTCVRDYVHVEDLVDAHVAVLGALGSGGGVGGGGCEWRAYNLGIGRGYSVREIIDAARRVTGVELVVREGARRPGDPPVLFADPSLIAHELGWFAKRTDLAEIIESAWRWMRDHPRGYASRG